MIYPKVILVLMAVGGSPTSGMEQIEMPSMEVCEREAQNFRDNTAGLGGTRAVCVTTGDTRK
jgi:hypothetical protein